MMYRSIYFFVIVFVIVGVNVGCNKKAGNSQPAIHVSERVKIKRPAEQSAAKEEEQVAEKKGTEQSLVVSGETESRENSVSPEVAKQEVVEKDPLPSTELVDTSQQGSPQESEKAGAKTSEATASEKASEPKVALKTTMQQSMEKKNSSHSTGVEGTGIERKVSDSVSETQSESDEKPTELTNSIDLVGEQEALFGDQGKYYVKKGRVDPFAPFLNKPEPKTTDSMKKEIQRRTPRTPLERIALGQLTLTAVMRLPNKKESMALVEDSNGKGYIVKQGTYIGEKGGRVSSVLADKLVVEEKYDDVFGKTSVRQIELKLQKQLGE